MNKQLNVYSSNYDSSVLVAGFSSEINDKCMDVFVESCNLSNRFRESTCYKHPPDPSCIDLYLTNSLNSLRNSTVVETGLSHFPRMTVTITITPFQRSLLKIRHCKDYSNYDYNIFL